MLHVSRRLLIPMVMVMALSVSLASAQGPQPQGNPTVQAPAANASLSAVISNATALKDSLTVEQVQAIQDLLQRHTPEFAAVTAQLPGPNMLLNNPGNASNRIYLPMVMGSGVGAETTQAAPAAVPAAGTAAAIQKTPSLLAATRQLDALQSKIDADLTAILTPEQQALYEEGLAPARNLRQAIDAPVSSAATNRIVRLSDAPSLQANANYCYVGGQYASSSAFWAYYAYLYGYLNYINNVYGSYNAYYYLLYDRVYAVAGLEDVSAGFYDLINLGSDFNGYTGAGITANYNAYAYASTGYSYAGANYQSYGYSYAYYAYLYGYYAAQYGYNAYYYNYLCYYA